MHDDTVPLLTFVVTLNRVKIPEHWCTVLTVIIASIVEASELRPGGAFLARGSSIVCAPLCGRFKFYILTERVLCLLVLPVKRLFSSVYGICDHLVLSFRRTQTSMVSRC